jgi:leucyl/phenylalanyl-tRNA--protein transferase
MAVIDPELLLLDGFHLSRSLRKVLRSGQFHVTHDTAFAQVVARCARREETWINADIEASYVELHRRGRGHSVECWQDGELVGGLYGVCLGAAFFGESMFSVRPDASKVALAWLVARLKVGGFRLLDCQFMTDHLRSLGAVEITQADYMELLTAALGSAVPGGPEGGDSEGAPEFGALDRLLTELPGGSADAPSGCVIAQLIGQTS